MKIAPAIAGIAAAAALLLSGCASGLNHGVITGKEYSAGYWYTGMYCSVWYKYGCMVWDYPQEWQPPVYTLDLKDGKQTGSVSVDEVTWDRAKAGQVYP